MWTKFADLILKRRIIMLIISLLITSFMLYKGKDVELSFAGAKVLPINAPSFVAYENFKQQYGEDGTVLVVGLQSEKIIEQQFLNDWQKLSNDLKKNNRHNQCAFH
jgi:predicted RND superfamily exporter protein